VNIGGAGVVEEYVEYVAAQQSAALRGSGRQVGVAGGLNDKRGQKQQARWSGALKMDEQVGAGGQA
jgi:hypothetical protein